MSYLAEFKRRAKALKAETLALYLATRDPRTPWYAKALVASIVAYAFRSIELIPDFVPVLGYVDNLILIPIVITFAVRLIPAEVIVECCARAAEALEDGKPVSRIAVAIVSLCSFSQRWGSLWGYELVFKTELLPLQAVVAKNTAAMQVLPIRYRTTPFSRSRAALTP